MTSLFFADETLDRRSDIRVDDAAMESLMQSADARYLLADGGRVRVAPGEPTRIEWLAPSDIPSEAKADAAFLGFFEGKPRFAAFVAEPRRKDTAPGAVRDGSIGLLQAATALAPVEAQMAGRAAHLAHWAARSRHCGACGAAMRSAEGGHKRVCTSSDCGREEFPRTDPVVTALVTYGERCLLARQPKFPPRFYAPLAGFVEPGEAFETAVRREVAEESGLALHEVTYIGSQPWPFPGSVMIGFVAEARDDKLTLDRRELEAALWLDRREVTALRQRSPEARPDVRLPPIGVIGERLIAHWLSKLS